MEKTANPIGDLFGVRAWALMAAFFLSAFVASCTYDPPVRHITYIANKAGGQTPRHYSQLNPDWCAAAVIQTLQDYANVPVDAQPDILFWADEDNSGRLSFNEMFNYLWWDDHPVEMLQIVMPRHSYEHTADSIRDMTGAGSNRIFVTGVNSDHVISCVGYSYPENNTVVTSHIGVLDPASPPTKDKCHWLEYNEFGKHLNIYDYPPGTLSHLGLTEWYAQYSTPNLDDPWDEVPESLRVAVERAKALYYSRPERDFSDDEIEEILRPWTELLENHAVNRPRFEENLEVDGELSAYFARRTPWPPIWRPWNGSEGDQPLNDTVMQVWAAADSAVADAFDTTFGRRYPDLMNTYATAYFGGFWDIPMPTSDESNGGAFAKESDSRELSYHHWIIPRMKGEDMTMVVLLDYNNLDSVINIIATPTKASALLLTDAPVLIADIQEEFGNPVSAIQSVWDRTLSLPLIDVPHYETYDDFGNTIMIDWYGNYLERLPDGTIDFTGEKFSKSSSGGRGSILPETYRLAQNYPNPFNPMTQITFTLPEAGDVRLEVYNIRGQQVITLVDGFLAAGRHTATWNASTSAASGVYLYRITAGNYVAAKKMVLMK